MVGEFGGANGEDWEMAGEVAGGYDKSFELRTGAAAVMRWLSGHTMPADKVNWR